MCDPITITTMAVSAAGTAFGAIQQSQTANANAKAIRNQQIGRRQQADFDTDRALDQRRRVLSSQVAGFNASGVSLEGSALEVIGDTTEQSALDVAAIQHNAEVDINNLESRRLGQKTKGRNALVAGAIGSIGAALNKAPSSSNATFLRGPFAQGAT